MHQVGAQQGWQCPICGYIYSPTWRSCDNCNRPDNEKYTISTNVTMIPDCEHEFEVRTPGPTCIKCGLLKIDANF